MSSSKKKNVKYFGHVISAEGITTDPEKISAVENWPVPHSKKQLRSFLGFSSYYRKFVKGFLPLQNFFLCLPRIELNLFGTRNARMRSRN